MSDSINPDHYKRLPVEAIEIIESAIQGAPSVEAGYLHGQVLKYVLRCWAKGGIEDLQKAKWYLDRLVESEKRPVIKRSLITEFKVGDRVRVCKPGSLLDGKVGRVDRIHRTDHSIQIEVSYEHAWELFEPSELQPVEAKQEPTKPAFAVGDRVRVCKPGSFLSGIAGVIQSVDGDDRIEVKNKTGWGFFRASDLQPAEAGK